MEVIKSILKHISSQQQVILYGENLRGWPVGEGLGTDSVLLSRSQVRIPLGANNSCVGLVHTKLCFGFKWGSTSGRWD